MYKQLTSEQRYTISVLLQNGMKQKDIAKAINVSPSTVSREIRRNSGIRGHYNWETAQANAVRTKRKKPGNRSVDKDVMEEAKRLLVTEQWSPEQISGALANDGKYICHETIYRMIRKDKVVSLKVCNSSFLSLYFHCYFILFFPVFELIYSPFICRLCFLHRHGCQEEDDGLF